MAIVGTIQWPWSVAWLQPPTGKPELEATVADIHRDPTHYIGRNIRAKGIVFGQRLEKNGAKDKTVPQYSFGLHEEDGDGRLLPHNVWVAWPVNAFDGVSVPDDNKELALNGVLRWGWSLARIEEY